jgi:hypothetical protein
MEAPQHYEVPDYELPAATVLIVPEQLPPAELEALAKETATGAIEAYSVAVH